VRIERVAGRHLPAWATMRAALWPDEDPAHLAEEAAEWLADADDARPVWIALNDADAAIGFAEAALRHDYVNGCDGSPVAFLEAIYVVPEWRRGGIARALVESVAGWARARGIAEFASDALLDNHASHAFHARVGFAETERVVYFRRQIAA